MLFGRDLPTLQTLQAFQLAARGLSFTAAAKQLDISQSAVSQQVRHLEQQLGVSLFRRVYRGVELTDQGQQLYGAVESGFSDIAACLDQLRRQQQRPRLRVATDFAFAAYWLMPRLADFRQQHPDIDVQLITSQDSQFDSQDMDVALLFRQPEQLPRPGPCLFRERVYPLLSPALLERLGPIDNVQQLLELPLLKLRGITGHPWQDWPRFFSRHEISFQGAEPVLTFDNYTLLIQALLVGQGVGIGWSGLVDDLVEQGLLVGLEQFAIDGNAGYYIIDSGAAHQPQGVRTFIQWLLESASQNGSVSC